MKNRTTNCSLPTETKNQLSEQKLNILFLSSWYPSRVHNTLGNFVQRHAEAVALLHNVTVLYFAFEKDTTQDPQIEDSVHNRVRSIVVYGKKSFPQILQKWQTFQKGIDYIETNTEIKFDIIHHNVIWNAGWQAVFLSRRYKIPFIITEHWTSYDLKSRNDQPKFLKSFSKWVTKKSSAICPVSKDLGFKMQNFGLAGNYITVPNVVDTELFVLSEKPKDKIQYLHVSSLDDRQKNITGILNVWKKISSKNPDIRLVLGGDGPIEHYKSMAKKLEIPNESIQFFGEKKPEDIAQLMNESHCLILFSNYENLPVVIVEALASGMFILSTDVGGISEHINSDRGLLIGAGDESGLEKIILDSKEILQNFEPVESRTYAIEHFNRTSVAQQFDDVYKSVLNKN